jgi:hypothetical protein
MAEGEQSCSESACKFSFLFKLFASFADFAILPLNCLAGGSLMAAELTFYVGGCEGERR